MTMAFKSAADARAVVEAIEKHLPDIAAEAMRRRRSGAAVRDAAEQAIADREKERGDMFFDALADALGKKR
jgi:hypothetical protein